MNKKMLFCSSMAALALVACNKPKEIESPLPEKPDSIEAQDSVLLGFGAYVNRGTSTKQGVCSCPCYV